jgi:hypothetical protein
MAIRGIATMVALALASAAANAGPCDAYYAFDGSLQDGGGNGYHGQMIDEDGGQPSAQFVKEGQLGAALHFTGTSAMRAFLDLHFDTCPRVTLTAWVRLASNDYAQTQYLISTGGGSGPGLRASGSLATLKGTGNGISQYDAFRDPNTWFFVAGTWDWTAGTYRLYWRSRTVDGELSGSRYDTEDSLWVGAFNDAMGHPAQDFYIDDLRIYGRVLEPTEINTIRAAGSDRVAVAFVPTGQAAPTASSGGGAFTPGVSAVGIDQQQPLGATATPTAVAPGGFDGPPCSTPGECPTGFYCAFDQMCHPESHLPMQTLEFQEVQVAPVTEFVLHEDARFEDPPEETAASGGPAALGPTGGAGEQTVEESLAALDFGAEPTGEVRDCTSFAEVTADLFKSARDAIVDVAGAVGCTLLTLPVQATSAAASLVDAAGYETDEFRRRLLAETYDKCIAETQGAAQLPDKAVAFWNSATGRSTWATIGPRRLKSVNEGNIIAPGDRKFISDLPLFGANNGQMRIDELDGRARITGRVCTVDMANRYKRIIKFTLNDTPEERQNQSQTQLWDLNDVGDKLLIVYMDGAGRAGQNFKYKISFSGLPLPPP